MNIGNYLGKDWNQPTKMTTIVDTTLRFTNDSHETSTEQQETDIAE